MLLIRCLWLLYLREFKTLKTTNRNSLFVFHTEDTVKNKDLLSVLSFYQDSIYIKRSSGLHHIIKVHDLAPHTLPLCDHVMWLRKRTFIVFWHIKLRTERGRDNTRPLKRKYCEFLLKLHRVKAGLETFVQKKVKGIKPQMIWRSTYKQLQHPGVC